MKSKRTLCLAVVGLVILILAGVFGIYMAVKYLPSKKWVDKGELLQVQGEQTAIFLNSQFQEVKGINRDGQIYLPGTWVNEHLNERFYWDDIEKLLVYTLPDAVVYADKRTLGTTGAPLLLAEENQVYLALGLVSNYTNIQVKSFSGDQLNRVYVDNTWGDWNVAYTKRAGKVREKGSIKSSIITELPEDSILRILETVDHWSKVETPDGYIGYVRNQILGESSIVPQISTFVEPVYTSISRNDKVSLVWHQVTAGEANKSMESLMANVKGVNVIAPTWFALTDNMGNYESYADKSYVDKAHAMGLQVWGVVDNFNKGENVDSSILFAPTSVRRTLIDSLIQTTMKYGIDGINLDIEGIKPAAGPHYVQFIRELSIECRKNGIILSVDNYVPSAYTSFYNRKEQGQVVDYVIMMGYDEHYAGGEMGSVASLPFVAKGIEDMLKEVPREKLIAAVPFYTRVWMEREGKTTSSALGLPGVKKWVDENKVELYWQEELGQYYGELNTEEGIKFVWMEDEISLGLKMDQIRGNDLAGAAFWKLGLEMAEIWDVVKVND